MYANDRAHHIQNEIVWIYFVYLFNKNLCEIDDHCKPLCLYHMRYLAVYIHAKPADLYSNAYLI